MVFKVKQFIKDYVKVGDEWRHIEVENKYTVNNYDDLQNLLLTLIDFSDGTVKLEIEKEAIRREGVSLKMDKIKAELKDLNAQRDSLKERWEEEKKILSELQNARQKMENYKIEANNAERSGDYGKVAEIRYGKMAEAQKQIDEDKKNVKKNLCIAFYPEQMQIMLKNGGFYHALKVVSGNEKDFDGEYKIEFFGQEGVVNVQKKGEV